MRSVCDFEQEVFEAYFLAAGPLYENYLHTIRVKASAKNRNHGELGTVTN